MPLTFQMVNVIQDDLYDGWLQFAKWHGTQEYLTIPGGIPIGLAVPPALIYGAHNDKRIPRAAIRVYGSTLSGSVSSPSVLTSVPNVFGRVLRQGVGVFDVEVNLSEYFADAVPFGVGLGGNLASLRPPPSTRTREPPARCVSRASSSTVEPAAASVETDFDFVAHIYGTP